MPSPTPEHRLKFQIENVLNMRGLHHGTKPDNELVDAIFEALFNEYTAPIISEMLVEIAKQK